MGFEFESCFCGGVVKLPLAAVFVLFFARRAIASRVEHVSNGWPTTMHFWKRLTWLSFAVQYRLCFDGDIKLITVKVKRYPTVLFYVDLEDELHLAAQE